MAIKTKAMIAVILGNAIFGFSFLFSKVMMQKTFTTIQLLVGSAMGMATVIPVVVTDISIVQLLMKKIEIVIPAVAGEPAEAAAVMASCN